MIRVESILERKEKEIRLWRVLVFDRKVSYKYLRFFFDVNISWIFFILDVFVCWEVWFFSGNCRFLGGGL